jgi:hypothetical protein
MAPRKVKQKGKGVGMSMPLAKPSLLEIIRANMEDEDKMNSIYDALHIGSDINEKDETGKTPLLALVSETNLDGESYDFYTDLIDEFIRKGVDVNYTVNEMSALHLAARENNDAYCIKLIENGANVNILNNNNETPAFIASRFSSENTLKILLDNGANIHLVNNNGQGLLDIVGIDNEIEDLRFKEYMRKTVVRELCDRGLAGPQCAEIANWNPILNILRGYREQIANALTVEIPNQGFKNIPQDKIENIITRSDFIHGEEIIVITENGNEFFYKLEPIRRWFATKQAAGQEIRNPATNVVITNQNQISRWTARIQTGGKKTKKRLHRKKVSKTRSLR